MLLQIIGEKKSKFIQILTSCNGFIKINMHLIPNQVIKKNKTKKNTVSVDLFKALVTHLGKKEREKNPKNKQTKKQVTSQILES